MPKLDVIRILGGEDMLVPKNQFSRSGKLMPEIRGQVFHYVGASKATAQNVARYFGKDLPAQDPNDDIRDRYAGTHFAIGIDGHLIRMIPEDEVAYHVGAWTYQPGIEAKFSGYPNNYLLGTEMSHIDDTGKHSPATIQKAQWLGAYSAFIFGFHPYHDTYRHYDITGKICPKWYVNNPDDWEEFKIGIVDKYHKIGIWYDRRRMNSVR